MIAMAHGMTATFLFVLLVQLDDEETARVVDRAIQGVVPTTLLARPIVFTQKLFRKNFRQGFGLVI